MALFHARSRDSATARSAAEADLRAAVARDPHQHRAWSTLSVLRFRALDYAGALAAARRALQEDPYATDRGEVLWNAYFGAFQLGDDDAARSFCEDFARRDPHQWLAAMCALQLQAWSDGAPDLAAASTRHRGISRDPGAGSTGDRIVDLAYAAVLARAGLRDSARALIARARDPSQPDLLLWETKALVLLRDDGLALDRLRVYLRAYPDAKGQLARERCFARLRANPAFLELVGPTPPPAGSARPR